MPTSVRRAILALLVFAAVAGWVATIILASTVYVPASSPDQGLAANAQAFITDYVKAEGGNGAYEQAEHWLTGQALEAVKAEAAANAASVPGLDIVGKKVDAVILWRAGNQALAEVTFTLTAADGSTTPVGEHMLMVFKDGLWRIDTIWRIQAIPGTPLLPGASATPGSSPSPSAAP